MIFYPLGSGVGPIAWRLMNRSGQRHLLVLLEVLPPGQGLEPFRATAADAYCYHVALKYERAPHALRSMALDADHGDYVSRCKTSYEDIAKKNGTRSKRFERASLEA